MSSNLVELIEFESIKRTFNKPRFSYIKEDETKHWNMAIGTLFYLIYDDACQTNPGEKLNFIDRLPFCYHPNHLFNFLLPSITCLMGEKQNYLATYRAVCLGLSLAERISPGSMSKAELEMQVHSDFLTNLIRITIYSSCEEVRRSGFRLFTKYYSLFETNHARYRLVNIVLDTANHSGLMGQIIVNTKDTAMQQMTTTEEDLPNKQFSGHGLKVLIRKICSLKHGVETDLLEISDEIISSLNMLICLMLKDKSKNGCGIWDLTVELNTNYLKPLKTAIEMSRAHYQRKLMEKHGNDDKGIDEVSLSVGGQTLPHMTTNQKNDVVNAALNTLSLIECVLCQLNSVIDK